MKEIYLLLAIVLGPNGPERYDPSPMDPYTCRTTELRLAARMPVMYGDRPMIGAACVRVQRPELCFDFEPDTRLALLRP